MLLLWSTTVQIKVSLFRGWVKNSTQKKEKGDDWRNENTVSI